MKYLFVQTENVSYRIDIEVLWGLQHKEGDFSDGKNTNENCTINSQV